ncbi:MAG: hypothetical protein BWY06_03424 [Candidatus Latescibacteria bacterium ADurb.Bin168]|nr:MAG: hypothetical protein BWY06_03424 [Candidatus Latescibacteria bacterium ADurb.Bin168]
MGDCLFSNTALEGLNGPGKPPPLRNADNAVMLNAPRLNFINDVTDADGINADPVKQPRVLALHDNIPDLLNVLADLFHDNQVAVFLEILVTGRL